MSSWIRLVAIVGVAALVAACGSETGDGDGDARSAGSTPIEGRTLVVTAVTDAGKPHAVVPGSQIRLTFTDGTLGLQAGCNALSGSYTIDGDMVTVGPIGGTEMGCPQDLMAQDTWLAGLFAAPVTIAEDPLTLTAGDVVLELADRADVSPDASLTGTRWVLDSIVTGDAASSVPQGVEAELTIRENGRVLLTTGCNGAGGTVEITGDSLVWGEIVRELRACPGPAGEVERRVLAVLAGETAYRIEEKSLSITNRDEGGLGFRAEAR
jgi:heat shock protein HslJ